MHTHDVVDLIREALMMALILGGPLLAVSAVVGLAMGLVQAVTNLHEQSLTFVPKLIAVGAALICLLPWLISRMAEYAAHVIRHAPHSL